MGAAFKAGAAATGRRQPFPGMNLEVARSRGETVRSTTISALLHGLILLLLFVVAAVTHVIPEEVLPVTLIKETPPPPPPPPPEEAKVEPSPEPEPAPAPKALAERKSLDFKPQAQAIAPQVINPTVIQQAAPAVNAEALKLNTVAPINAPKDIAHATVVAERVTVSDSLAAAQTAKVDMGASAAPALKGPANATLPVGESSGPRQIVARGDTTGTGTVVNMANGSSVREGIASNRDVLGSPDGGPVADVNTRVGQGLMRGEGGNGTGGTGNNSDCLERPEVKAYIENQIRQRMYTRWALPQDAPVGSKVELRFQLDSSGSLMTSSLKSASNTALGQSAVEALRSSAPFMAMTDRVRCLARRELTGTFTVPSAAGG
jgi:hypothetical protein